VHCCDRFREQFDFVLGYYFLKKGVFSWP
jgi:hypothetical protein